MTTTMYYVYGYSDKIEKVEIVRSTGKSVWVRSKRANKERRANRDRYYNTFEEAKENIVRRCVRRIETLEMQVENAKKRHQEAMRLSEEDAAWLTE